MYKLLPKIKDLNIDQKMAMKLLNGRTITNNNAFMIVGGPGTGKSIIAAHLFTKFVKEGKKVQLLAFNKNLKYYLKDAVGSLLNQDQKSYARAITRGIHTFDSWLMYLRNHIYNCINPEDYFAVKEQEIQKMINNGQYNIKDDICIIDEAQDLSLVEHEYLKKSFRQVIILIDINQSMHSERHITSLNELKKLYSCFRNVFFLSSNYRNTRQIYDFASAFNNHKEFIITKPLQEGRIPTIYKHSTSEEMISKIVNIIINRTNHTIGIFVPTSKSEKHEYLQTFVYNLQTAYKLKSNKVRTFVLPNKSNNQILKFEKDSVHILELNKVKGLEYDIVIIPMLNNKFFTQTARNRMLRTYVGITRAKKEFYGFYNTSLKQPSFFLSTIEENTYRLVSIGDDSK